jgi:hypothetical protein
MRALSREVLANPVRSRRAAMSSTTRFEISALMIHSPDG